jgi:peptidoglycan/LPS O-acetylase OafA/YrhL
MRLKALDVLRAVAVLLVIGRHFDIFHSWFMLGWTGVNLFFVLSGFLISGLLFTEYKAHSRICVGHFLVRRGFKIYPPFYLLMAGTLGMYVLYHWHKPVPWPRFIGELVFLQNYYHAFWIHTWSLAVEEHFYIALPLLLVVLVRFSKNRADPFRALPAIFLMVALVVFAARLWIFWPVTEPVVGRSFQTTYQIDSLLFGVLISYFFHFRRQAFLKVSQWNRPLLALASFLCVAPCIYLDMVQSYFVETTGHTLLYLGFGGMVVLAVTWADSASGKAGSMFAMAGAALAYIGRYSYSIYLWHIPVNTWGLDFLARVHRLPGNRAAQFLIYLAGSLLLGIAMSKLVEYPALKLRDKLFPSRSTVLVPALSAASSAEPSTAVRVGDSSAVLITPAEPPIFEKG